MSILIKDMDIPENCAACRFRISVVPNKGTYCLANLHEIDPLCNVMTRSIDCPLVKIEEGRK